MNLTDIDIPPLSGSGSAEIKEIKDYLWQLTERLRYMFSNLDTENFSESFADSVAIGLKESIGGVKSELSRESGRLRSLESALSALPRIQAGTAELTAGQDADISFAFEAAPAVAACYAALPDGQAWTPLTVHTVTPTGAKLCISGALPLTANAAWIAAEI